jgi:hypothetical protein
MARLEAVLGQIAEPDWKVFRKLQPLALDRFCERVLGQVADVLARPGEGAHERYLALWALLQERDKVLGDTFNAPRRSQAILQLLHMCRERLLTDEEFSRFSAETKDIIQRLLAL